MNRVLIVDKRYHGRFVAAVFRRRRNNVHVGGPPKPPLGEEGALQAKRSSAK